MQLFEIFKEEEQDKKGLEIKEPKGLEIDEPKGLEIDAPKKDAPTGKNWQSKALSRDAWMLIFFRPTFRDKYGKYARVPANKKRLEYLYNKLIVRPPADYSPSMLRMKMSSQADVQLLGNTPEEMTANLIQKIQQTVGITIGPSWTIKSLKGQKVKDVELVKAFIRTMQEQMRDDPKSDDPDPTTKFTPLTVEEANKIAANLHKYITDPGSWFVASQNPGGVLGELEKINTIDDYNLVKQKYSDYAAGGDSLEAELQELAKDKEYKKVMQKVDMQLRRIGVNLVLDKTSPYNVIQDIDMKLGDEVTASNWPKLSSQLDKWKENEDLKDMVKFVQSKNGKKLAELAMQEFFRQLKKLNKEKKDSGTKPTVREVVELYNKYYFNYIRTTAQF
tara:strand:+ start:1190 stop:2359 length:1170 start_codon:yes stop_codon:yes gene_type:complete